MNLVDEEERSLPRAPALFRALEDFAQISDAGEDRRDLLEFEIGFVREKPRNRRLADAGRAPENDRGKALRLQHAPKRRAVRQNLILPDDLIERLRSQPVGERTRRFFLHACRLEEIAHALSTHPPGRDAIAGVDFYDPTRARGLDLTLKFRGG